MENVKTVLIMTALAFAFYYFIKALLTVGQKLNDKVKKSKN